MRQVFESLLFCLAFLFVAPLPHRMVYLLSRLLGRIAASNSRKLKKIAMANLDAAYGDSISPADKLKIVHQSFQVFASMALDVLWLAVFSERRVKRLMRADPSFEQVAAGSPVIIIGSHLGNWEALGLFVALKGNAVTSVAMPLKNAFVDRIWNRIRARTGQTIVSREGAFRRLIKTLKDGRSVALLLDQNTLPDEGGEFVDFFGLPVPVSKAVASLRRHTDAPAVYLFSVQQADGTYRAYARPMSALEEADNETQVMLAGVEKIVREYPGHWLWMYKRWKYIPGGAPPEKYPFYAKRYPVDTRAKMER